MTPTSAASDGYYSSLGRTDDIIKAGGIWVSPTEVEERLRQHPDGRRRSSSCPCPTTPGWTSRWPAPCSSPGSAVTADDLVAFCREGLAAFKRPRNVLVFDELPTTATGKLQRFRVRELALERLAGSATPDLAPTTGGPA